MCPDPSLLVAYLDRTLFHRDATAIDAHVGTCENCASLLAKMRRVRDQEQRSKRSRALVVGGIAALVAIASVGTWAALRRAPGTTPIQTASVPSATTTAPPAPSVPAEARLPSTPLGPGKAEAAKAPVRLPSTTLRPGKPDTTAKSPRVDRVEKPPRIDAPAVEGDVVLRGRDRRIVWRTRDRAIERSIDGGMTWTLEHTADRPLRAGALVDANVVWLVGENGLVLRRTKNGWFGTSPPGEGTIRAVRASSPSRATVTLDDGRLFRTENGGVTWSAQ